MGGSASLIGTQPRTPWVIDEYQWGRAALKFVHVSAEEHEVLATRVGGKASAEIRLLAIAEQCHNNKRLWQSAEEFGIPWQRKTWSALADLQKTYNKAVSATTLEPVQEHAAALSGSAAAALFGLSRLRQGT